MFRNQAHEAALYRAQLTKEALRIKEGILQMRAAIERSDVTQEAKALFADAIKNSEARIEEMRGWYRGAYWSV